MGPTIDIIYLFRKKMGNVYHFDILAVHSTLETYVVGCALVNSKTWATYIDFPEESDDFDREGFEKAIVETIDELEEVFSNS